MFFGDQKTGKSVQTLQHGADKNHRPIFDPSVELLIGLAFVGLACVYRILSFNIALFNGDEYVFALVARDVLHGKLPNAGVFDNKPVGLTYLFALAEWLGGQTVFAIRALGFVASAASGALLFSSGRTLGLRRGPSLLLASLFMLGSLCIGAFASMSELLACPFLAAANYLLIREKRGPVTLLGLGAAFGFACQITYLAAPCLALTLMGILLIDSSGSFKKRLINCALIVLGCGGAACVVWIPQVITGDFPAYVADQFRYHRGYRLSSFNWNDWRLGFANPLIGLLLPLLFIALLRLRQVSGGKALPSSCWIMGLQVLGAALAAAASNRFYPHYLILAAPADVLLMTILFANLSERRQGAGLILLSLILMGAAAAPIGFFQNSFKNPGIEVEMTAVVKRLTQPNQSIFVFNESPTVYYLAQRATVGRYVFPSHYISTCDHAPTVADPTTVLDQALARRPALVLLGAMCPPEIDAATQVRKAGYEVVDKIEAGNRRIDFYATSANKDEGATLQLNKPIAP